VIAKQNPIGVVALALACAGSSAGQQLTWQQAALFKFHDQGTQIQPAAQPHFDAALQAAGTDFIGALLECNSARPEAMKWKMPSAAELLGAGDAPGQPPEPTRVFDNLYFLSVGKVAAWAVATPDGIILIDSLNNKDEVRSVIEPGLRKFGLDPAQIKYVVITHGHGDHFGGSAYIEQKYHAHILMSDADWTLAPTMVDQPFFDPPPMRDRVIHDGDKLILGGVTLTLYLTPGHTPGSVSILIPVTDRGHRHVAALWGGTGFNFPHSPAAFKLYSDSAQRFAHLAAAAGADISLSPHSVNDGAIKKVAVLKTRGVGDPNPFVTGQDAVRRLLTIYSECALAYGAQLPQ
jgi:metallo-beta-lactamase class B